MKYRIKLKITLIFALALSLILSLGALFAINYSFADRAVTINGVSGTNILNPTDGAELQAHKDGTEYYLAAVINSDNGSVNYRKNLAYEWYYNSKEEVSKDVPSELTMAKGFFNMEIGLAGSGYERFVIAFESQQFAQTKDGKTTNYIFFVPADGGKTEAHIACKSADDENADDAFKHAHNLGALDADHIKITFNKDDNTEAGCYDVTLSSGTASYTYKFENVGATYAKYSSSTTSPLTPLSFKAKFAENAENASAKLALYSINNQLFRLGTFTRATISTAEQANLTNYYTKGTDKYRYEKVKQGEQYDATKDYYSYRPDVTENGSGSNVYYTLGSGSSVNDDTPPVLCLNSGITYIREGEEISFDYTIIDVLQTGSSTSNYFMLTEKQKEAKINANDLNADGLYREVKDSDNQYMIVHANHYIPATADYGTDGVFGDDFIPKAAVKVYLRLTDSYSGNSYLLLDWYVEDKYLLEIGDYKYIAVAKDELGVTYGYTSGKTSNPESSEWTAKVNAYQDAVDAAAKEQKLQAGTKNYFYLPSVETLLSDGVTDYKDLSYSIYYKTDSDTSGNGQSATSKSYSELSINISRTGNYLFTVYAYDAARNNMYYYTVEDGEPVVKTFTGSEVWSMRAAEADTDYEGLENYVPWFTFTVGSAELTVEDPGEQDTAYVGTPYTFPAFDVNGVSYTSKYTLFLFDSERYFNDMHEALTYEKFMAQKDKLFEEHQEDWFIKIYDINDMQENSEEYEEYADYKWDASGRSFIPQNDNAFYIVRCVSSSTENQQKSVVSYMGISASVKVKSIKGEDTWLQDNMTSIILLCIAGVSLIGIILLLVIKPKEKGDIDELLAAEKKADKKSKNKKS